MSRLTKDAMKSKIESGAAWLISGQTTVASGVNFDLIVHTANTTAWPKMDFEFAGGSTAWTMYEGATYTGGTTITPVNLNRNKTATSAGVSLVFASPSLVTVSGADTVDAGLTSQTTTAIGGGGLKVLKQNTIYCYRMTSAEASDFISWRGVFEDTNI